VRVTLDAISLQYDGAAPLLAGVSLSIDAGEFVLIRGPSGVGKSSLLRLINGLQQPTSGRLLVDGREVPAAEITDHRRRVGYVQQTPVMVEGSVEDNLLLPFSYRSARDQLRPTRDMLAATLDLYRLGDVPLESDATALSVGQQQRVALIRAVMTQPAILLCDEPMSALDPESREIVEARLEATNVEDGVGVVMVTHADYEPKRPTVRRLRLSSEKGLEEEDG
jgi:putative ABC transport system ATP-binding protein